MPPKSLIGSCVSSLSNVLRYSARQLTSLPKKKLLNLESPFLWDMEPRCWALGARCFDTSRDESGINLDFRSLKLRPLRCLGKSGIEHTVTRLHIPRERIPQLHRCESLKPHTYIFTALICKEAFLMVISRCDIHTQR